MMWIPLRSAKMKGSSWDSSAGLVAEWIPASSRLRIETDGMN